MKWLYKIQRFMIGRYGIDELYKFLFNVYLILFFPNIFLRNSIVTKIEFIILFIAIVILKNCIFVGSVRKFCVKFELVNRK